jgi:hypothetical protein
VHQFHPTYSSEWLDANIKTKFVSFNNLTVKKMSFDILCDLKTIQEISLLNTKYLNVYQFDKPISDSLQKKT